MPRCDLLVRNARLVDGPVEQVVHLAVQDGRVAAILADSVGLRADRCLEADGRVVIPGLIDTHVHLGNANRPFEADLRTESRSAAAGGVTTMLVHTTAEASYREVVPRRRRAVEAESLIDIGLHLIMTSLPQMAEIPALATEFKTRSFKAFMAYKDAERSPSGIVGVSDGELLYFLQQVAEVRGGRALVHCENMEIIHWLQQPLRAAGRQDTAAWTAARPPFGELEAIRRALAFAAETGAHLVVPHLSVGRGSEFLRQKRWGRGALSVESCPHYLALDSETDRGVVGKVNPPLRGQAERAALWERLSDGTVDVIGSDTCPYTRAVKGDELWTARAGLPTGVAMILPVLLTEGLQAGRLSWPRLIDLTSRNAARLFGLYPQKGSLAPGADADFVILDLERSLTVDLERLQSVSDYSPYEGYLSRGWPAVTVSRGRVVYEQDQVLDDGTRGRWLH